LKFSKLQGALSLHLVTISFTGHVHCEQLKAMRCGNSWQTKVGHLSHLLDIYFLISDYCIFVKFKL
jgi:transcription elongation factor Elf1